MNLSILLLRIVFGAFFCFAGLMHFLKPKFFSNFIPNFFSKKFVNWSIGLLELVLGFSLFIDVYAHHAALGMMILLFALIPIHIWDYLKEKPAIGSKKVALIRIPFQFLLIYGAYLIYTNT